MRQILDGQRVDRLATIIETQRALAGADADLPQLVAITCERVHELTGADEVSVLLLDEDGYGLWVHDGVGSSQRTPDAFPLESFKGAVLQANEARLCQDTELDPTVNQWLAQHTGARSLAAAPLRYGNEPIGVLNAMSRTPDTFDEGDLQTLELLAIALSGALVYASVREDIAERRSSELALRATTERLARIVETQADVAAAGSSLAAALQIVAERALTLTNAEGVAIWLPEGGDLRCTAAVGIAAPLAGRTRPRAGSIMAAAFEARRPILIEDSRSDPRLDHALLDLTGERSHVSAVLVQDSDILAAMNLISGSAIEPLSEDDRRAIELFTVVLSAAISRTAEAQALARFAAIYQRAPIGIGLVGLDGVFVDANVSMCEITGRTLDELWSGPIADHMHPNDAEEAMARFRLVARGELDGFRYETRYLRPNGEVAWVDATASLLRDEAGKPQFVLVMGQDVTARRAAEEQLRHSQKIEAIGQLTAGIAHDFNNVLMGVLGYAGLARDAVPGDSDVSGYLAKIEASGQRAATLTRQLLAFGRRQTLQPRLLHLNELVVETLGMLDRVLGEPVEIVPLLEPSLPPLRADPTQLQQVLFNLALNARDAMPEGGLLEIRTTCEDLDEDGAHGLELAPGTYVVLSVRDTGTGMSPEVRARIFEPFFTTKGIGEGSGLGLASVYGIVKQSRGDITVESEQGAGTTFRIHLPIEAAP